MTADATRWQDYLLPIGIVGSLLVILVPLPPALMDLLLAVNITVSVLVLLTAVYVRRPLEFSIFPSLLLAATLGRLVLNVATTRLILSHADTLEMHAAGEVIRTFGQFVAGDRIVVGLIMFVIIVVIQFVVITKGATRISEVAARFALDGMPGRQMAIDADLNSGVIDQREALRRREELTQQADFYGAMDGASKFVRGDAVAGILITAVNILGGLIIGIGQAGMSPARAAEVYTMLTIGDGLVSQVPALLISLAAALLVTRGSQSTRLPRQFLDQLFSRPQALAVAGGFLLVLIFTNLPKLPLLALGSGCCVLAVVLSRRENRTDGAAEPSSADSAADPRRSAVAARGSGSHAPLAGPPSPLAGSSAPLAGNSERPEDYLLVDPMELEIGLGLIRLADPQRGGDLLGRIASVRQAMASDMGIVLPKVRIRDNMRLDRHGYRIKVAGNPAASGKVYPSRLLAVDSGRTLGPLDGEPAEDPASGRSAYWITPDMRPRAESRGYTVRGANAVLAEHLQAVVAEHADELLTRDATRHLINELRKTAPAAVDELIPSVMKLGEVQQVLQLLLRERVPIKPLGTILEALGDYAPRCREPQQLTEFVRQRLSRLLCTRYRDANQRLHVLTLDPDLEARLADALEWSELGLAIRVPPPVADLVCRRLAAALPLLTAHSWPPVILTSPEVRAGLKQLTAASLPELVVLAYNEITRDTRIESVGMVTESWETSPSAVSAGGTGAGGIGAGGTGVGEYVAGGNGAGGTGAGGGHGSAGQEPVREVLGGNFPPGGVAAAGNRVGSLSTVAIARTASGG